MAQKAPAEAGEDYPEMNYPPSEDVFARSSQVVRGLDVESEELDPRGLGPDSAGQSGDTQGLSRSELDESESVEDLIEEGQYFEAGVVEGVENAPDADRGEVRTRQVPQDDVPLEYLDDDNTRKPLT